MATIPLTRVRVGAATSAAAVTLLVTAGLGNQALSSWRAARDTSDGWSGWVGVLSRPAQLTAWRFTSPGGAESTNHWLAPLVFNVVLVLGSVLLVSLAARGGGRLSTGVATWGAVTLAAAIAAAACTPLAYAGVQAPNMQTAQDYQLTVTLGLTLGFVLGFISGVLAFIFGGSGARAASATSATEAVPYASSGYESTATMPMPGVSWPQGEEQ